MRNFNSVHKLFSVSQVAAWMNLALVLLLAYSFASATWLAAAAMLPQSSQISVARTKQADDKNVSTGLEKIAGLHLMGRSESTDTAVAEPVSAPQTRLNLVLKGVFTGNEQEQGIAIIASNGGKEEAYRVGDVIGGAAEIYQIFTDRVILRRGDRFETLGLPNNDIAGGSGPSSATQRQMPVASRGHIGSGPVRNLSGVRQRILEEPLEAMKLVRAQPVMDGDNLKGYRVTPGENRTLFARAGLRPGDVVTSVNGIPLSNPGNMGKLYEQVKRGGRFEVTVERGGQPLTLSVKLD